MAGDEFGAYHISHVSLTHIIKEANLLRMIMSYKTCHDVTSSSPHAVVNDVCLLLLSGQWTNLSSVISCSIYIIVPCSRDMDITHYVISLSIVMARRFNVICFSYMTSLWTFWRSGIRWKRDQFGRSKYDINKHALVM